MPVSSVTISARRISPGYRWIWVFVCAALLVSCRHPQPAERPPNTQDLVYTPLPDKEPFIPYDDSCADYSYLVAVQQDVKVKEYKWFVDSLVGLYAPSLPYELTEYILVLHNPWIIDTLVSFDYYARKRSGQTIHDQKEMVVLHCGDLLRIPTTEQADSLQKMLDGVVIDVNIPEFVLRIYVHGTEHYRFTVRVGRNESKFLKMAGRVADLRTPVGSGQIVRVIYEADYINPVDNQPYFATIRDDGYITQLPLIPWLEPEIGGVRQGALIHPTTNEATLGKAYSNACVGVPEGAAWIIYYYAPLGTPVNFRYQLKIQEENGDTIVLKDIYDQKYHKVPDQTPVSDTP